MYLLSCLSEEISYSNLCYLLLTPHTHLLLHFSISNNKCMANSHFSFRPVSEGSQHVRATKWTNPFFFPHKKLPFPQADKLGSVLHTASLCKLLMETRHLQREIAQTGKSKCLFSSHWIIPVQLYWSPLTPN